MHFANSFFENDLGLSTTKCVCSASTPSLRKKLQKKWKALKTPYSNGVKSLGVGLEGGVYRNMKAIKSRLKGLPGRMHRFKQLRKVGVDTAMLLRAGGKQAMTYGEGVLGPLKQC